LEIPNQLFDITNQIGPVVGRRHSKRNAREWMSEAMVLSESNTDNYSFSFQYETEAFCLSPNKMRKWRVFLEVEVSFISR